LGILLKLQNRINFHPHLGPLPQRRGGDGRTRINQFLPAVIIIARPIFIQKIPKKFPLLKKEAGRIL
jgi:hypothetical protein